MQAVFSATEGEEVRVRAVARWDGSRVDVAAEDPADAEAVRRVFRATPVIVDDAAHRGPGTAGPVQFQPGSLEWFQTTALVRGPAETGMTVRLDPGQIVGGYDPAASYRTFDAHMAHLAGATPSGD